MTKEQLAAIAVVLLLGAVFFVRLYRRQQEPPKEPPKPRPLPLLGGSLADLLPKSFGELETEDIILLLILYLMYRESGDSELLIIMGAMFLL